LSIFIVDAINNGHENYFMSLVGDIIDGLQGYFNSLSEITPKEKLVRLSIFIVDVIIGLSFGNVLCFKGCVPHPPGPLVRGYNNSKRKVG
jgi:hypothetical protein